MANSKCHIIRTQKIKCPECLNYVIADIRANKDLYGFCSVCNSTIIKKQHSDKEKLIRILNHN